MDGAQYMYAQLITMPKYKKKSNKPFSFGTYLFKALAGHLGTCRYQIWCGKNRYLPPILWVPRMVAPTDLSLARCSYWMVYDSYSRSSKGTTL